MLKFSELVEGVEYWRYGKDKTKLPQRYKILNGLLYVLTFDGWLTSIAWINNIIESTFEECEWMPKRDQLYYYPYPDNNLYSNDYWKDDYFDFAIRRNVGIYRTREEAIDKAKELGWT
jgi:hypothetical protein